MKKVRAAELSAPVFCPVPVFPGNASRLRHTFSVRHIQFSEEKESRKRLRVRLCAKLGLNDGGAFFALAFAPFMLYNVVTNNTRVGVRTIVPSD